MIKMHIGTKRLISLLAALAIICSLVVVPAEAEEGPAVQDPAALAEDEGPAPAAYDDGAIHTVKLTDGQGQTKYIYANS